MRPSSDHLSQRKLVVFVDIVDSTSLYEQLGDVQASLKISSCLAQLGDLVHAFGGRVVKHIGDEVMCCFDDVVSGLHALIVAQVDMSRSTSTGSLPVRIGCHYGEVVVRNDDLFGDTVNLAARLAALAGPKQILTSQVSVEQYQSLRPNHSQKHPVSDNIVLHAQLQHRYLTRITPKGKTEEFDVCSINWEAYVEGTLAEWTFVEVKQLNVIDRQVSITLQYVRGHEIKLFDGDFVLLGRASDAQIQLVDNNVSRHHATVRSEHGNCFLKDQSSNGTYYESSDGESFFIHRNEVLITQQGRVSLGRNFKDADCMPITLSISKINKAYGSSEH